MTHEDFVVQIHSALAVRYGRRWLAMWAGLDMELVRADWRRQLRDYAHSPSSVMHALDNLPDQVPTANDFRHLCAAGPRPAYQPLPAPATSAQGKAAMRDLLDRLRGQGGIGVRGRGWAEAVMTRSARGEQVSPTVRAMAAGARRVTDSEVPR
ncbi:hypothetical protein [Acidovorax sp. Leaf160]|uniref:hypothetical protein n=1 Tax=Acidovorax sp. Leaf160 TaxID=1736280 RepID=UPI0006F639FF|nr:hypothetical protein [Acidovorax sp. Leaf160]KQR55639.1 hypothetical protein ASF94_04360 [Acidovorax sp. Leaf160]